MRTASLLMIVCAVATGCFGEVATEPSPPGSPGIRILPEAPRTGDDLFVEVLMPSIDPDGDLQGYSVAWSRDGAAPPEIATQTTIPAARTSKGEFWSVYVTARDDAGLESVPAFAGVEILNTPPTPPVVAVEPELPVAAEALQCVVVETSIDADDDLVSYSIAWRIDGEDFEGTTTTSLEGDTVPAEQVLAGSMYGCAVAAGDGEGVSPEVYAAVAVGEGDARVPDFHLPDVNPTSATYDQAVSPRDYLQKVSGWYFGHST